jgi:hypothetical protein
MSKHKNDKSNHNMKELAKDMAYGLAIALILLAIIMFSSGTTKFVYIDF